MMIDEYKDAIIKLVKDMDKEHGCDVDSMELCIERDVFEMNGTEVKNYRLKFVMI